MMTTEEWNDKPRPDMIPRAEAMRRDDYSHEAFDLHLAQINGETDDHTD